jgi:hypothetical protein
VCFGHDSNQEDNTLNDELSILKELQKISAEVRFRSGMEQTQSLSMDGTTTRVYNYLKRLVKEYDYDMQRLEHVLLGLDIWLYSIPTPPGFISMNPRTKFQHHRVMKVFLGSRSEFNIFINQKTEDQKSCDLNDTAFEERE